ncbi:Rossmann-like alpha/beta/alpha sandwich fold [Artemisia annua]|uniref:Rossmann-like alpha/beta/alpha sandwich fold n=1 Tax=Artemisia annua TaxID=35608 RepID=A0A2U1PK90_ARTAN|nr:Rossmann-like alpha/beta/alpha sandwich fold [Artemisia annua]
MVKNGSKIPSFCLAKIRPHVRVRSPSMQLKGNVDSSTKIDEQKTEDSSRSCNEKETKSEDVTKVEAQVKIIARKVMIVVDSSVEAKNALLWALTHTVQSNDILVLLYFKKIASKQGSDLTKEKATKVPSFLCSMKNMSQMKRSDVQVEISIAEGKEKGTTIVEEAKKQEVTMLVMGQKKQPITWRLLLTWAGRPMGTNGGGVVDYCVQNATCMAVAVRRKSKRVGGYLITTKRQKDFWLLA